MPDDAPAKKRRYGPKPKPAHEQRRHPISCRVNDAEINGRIAQMAMEQNIRPEKLRQDIINQNRVGAIYQQIREHKAMDAVLAKANITEVSAEDYNASISA